MVIFGGRKKKNVKVSAPGSKPQPVELDSEPEGVAEVGGAEASRQPEENGVAPSAVTRVPRKKKRKLILLDILIVVFAAVFLVSAYKLVSYYVSLSNEQSDLQDLADRVDQVAEQTEPTDSGTSSGDSDPAETASLYGESGMLLKYESLYQENNDMVGWLKIEGTEINYPVMYTPDEQNYYIRRDWNGDHSNSGMLFIDTGCDPLLPTTNQIIYGHNMKNGTMFADLLQYADEAFWEEHPVIQYDSLYEMRQYTVLAAFYTRILTEDEVGFRYYRFYNATNAEEFDYFYDNIMALSQYDTGVTASYGDQLITLSTCSYHTEAGRFVVVAVLMDDDDA